MNKKGKIDKNIKNSTIFIIFFNFYILYGKRFLSVKLYFYTIKLYFQKREQGTNYN